MLRTICFSLLIIFATNCKPTIDQENQAKPRNVLIIIGDDHSAAVMGSYGNPLIQTPNLDRLAAQGVQFNKAFANAPLCSASRQSLLTGRYPHATGVTLLTTSFPEEQVTIADHLSQQNYRTAIIGKNHFNNDLNHGFQIKIERSDYQAFIKNNPTRTVPDSIKTRPPWKPFRDHSRTWLNSETLPGDKYDQDDIGSWYAQQAVDFITENQDSTFCLVVGFHEPHSPFNFPVEYTGKYRPDDMPLPKGSPEDDQWIPLEFKDLTEEERRGIIASYYTSVSYLDKNIGIILEGLKDAGLEENTIVVYLGDHGYLLNDHKRFEKHMMWEPAVQAPLIIKPGLMFQQGKEVDALVEFVDVVPTILEIAGLPALPSTQGKSLWPTMEMDEEPVHEYVFSEFLADNKAMVKTQEWKYIFTTGKHDLAQGYATGNPPPGITHRLYDQINDPNETTNLAGEEQYASVVEEMQAYMLEKFKKTHPLVNQLPGGLTTEQQLVWFCEPPDNNANVSAF